MAEENNGNNLCESSDSIMTILDQMADSVQLDYTDQFSKDVEPTSSGLLELEQSKVCFHNVAKIFLKMHYNFSNLSTTDYGRPVRKLPSLHGQKFTPTPKFLGTSEAYFVCHISPNFQISLIYAVIGCP